MMAQFRLGAPKVTWNKLHWLTLIWHHMGKSSFDELPPTNCKWQRSSGPLAVVFESLGHNFSSIKQLTEGNWRQKKPCTQSGFSVFPLQLAARLWRTITGTQFTLNVHKVKLDFSSTKVLSLKQSVISSVLPQLFLSFVNFEKDLLFCLKKREDGRNKLAKIKRHMVNNMNGGGECEEQLLFVSFVYKCQLWLPHVYR